MSFKQFFPIPVIIALLATSMMVLDIFTSKNPTLCHYLPWVSFQAWAMYFLAGCTLKGGARVMLGYLGGAAASAAIMELAGLFAGWGLGQAAVPIAVFLIVIPVISAERVPGFNFVPAWFVGAGVFFGIMALKKDWAAGATTWAKYGTTFAYLMVSCAVGMVYGVVTVFLRKRYEAWVKAASRAAAGAARPSTPAASGRDWGLISYIQARGDGRRLWRDASFCVVPLWREPRPPSRAGCPAPSPARRRPRGETSGPRCATPASAART